MLAILPGRDALPGVPDARAAAGRDAAHVRDRRRHRPDRQRRSRRCRSAEALKILSGHRDAVNRRLTIVDLWRNELRTIGVDATSQARPAAAPAGSAISRGSKAAAASPPFALRPQCRAARRGIAPSGVSLAELAAKLRDVGRVTANAYLLRCEVDKYRADRVRRRPHDRRRHGRSRRSPRRACTLRGRMSRAQLAPRQTRAPISQLHAAASAQSRKIGHFAVEGAPRGIADSDTVGPAFPPPCPRSLTQILCPRLARAWLPLSIRPRTRRRAASPASLSSTARRPRATLRPQARRPHRPLAAGAADQRKRAGPRLRRPARRGGARGARRPTS